MAEIKPTTEDVELDYPINVGGALVNKLTMRRPKVKDRLLIEKLNLSVEEGEVRFLANLCEVAPENIEDLDFADYVKFQDKLSEMQKFPRKQS